MYGKYFQKLLLLIIILIEIQLNCAFNLSLKPNLVIKKPNIPTFKNQTRSSYFGYTIVLRENCMYIGAPRAQSTLKAQSSVNETGAVYKCSLKSEASQGIDYQCQPFLIDRKGSITNLGIESEIKDYQWLGGAMVGGSKHNDPLLICAPHFTGGDDLYKEATYLHGICYGITYTNGNATIFHKIRNLTDSHRQTLSYGDNLKYYYIFGQQGFSAHIVKNRLQFLMGAPGIHMWKGSVINYYIQSQTAQIPMPATESFTYFGYAVSSGNFESRDSGKIHYVASSPHDQQHFGEVLIFDMGITGLPIYKRSRVYGTKYGEYFGYSILVDDINNDQLDDIIVSAPFYNDDQEKDIGAVYVFINGGDFSFNSKLIVSPFKTSGHFGIAMSKLGDINNDGFNDFAISAPFADNHGAVAIYLGSDDGLQQEPCQILTMDSNVKMFGHGLSDGVDIDGNGFNDLAIGAPDSELVYIYLAYPLVYIEASIKAKNPRIPLNETLLEITFCWKMNTESKTLKEVAINLEIEVDTFLKRMSFSNDLHAFHLITNATDVENCQSLDLTITPVKSFQPMIIEMKYNLVNDAKKYTKEEFCKKCAVLEASSRTSVRSTVSFIHGCETHTCMVDLKLKALNIPTNFTLGSSNILYVRYSIQNSRENAHETKLELNSPLPLAKLPPNCWKDFQKKLNCKIGTGYNFKGTEIIEFNFNVKEIQNVGMIDIQAKVTSAGYEENENDNELNSTIVFKAHSIFEIVGQPNNTFETLFDEQENKNFNFSFTLQNNGPSTLSNFSLIFFMPFANETLKNKKMNFIIPTQSYASPIRNGIHYQSIPYAEEKLTEMEVTSINKTLINEYIRTVEQSQPQNTTISLYCNGTNTENCALARLPILLIKPSQKLTVDIFLNIDPKAVKKILGKKFDYLKIFMDVRIIPNDDEYTTLNITKIINPLILVNIRPEKTPLWIIIAAVVGGLITLIALTLGLRKLGFFKRQTKEEMEELINEKIEKQRMKDEAELRALEEDAQT